MKKLICIGGRNDGREIEVEQGMEVIQVPFVADPPNPWEEFRESSIYEIETYRQERIRCDGEDVAMLVIKGLPVVGAIRRLLSNYRPK